MQNIKKRITEKSLRLSMIIPRITKYAFTKVYLDTTTSVAYMVNEHYIDNSVVKYSKAVKCDIARYSFYWKAYCNARRALFQHDLYSDLLLKNMSCAYIKELYKCVKFMYKDTRPLQDFEITEEVTA